MAKGNLDQGCQFALTSKQDSGTFCPDDVQASAGAEIGSGPAEHATGGPLASAEVPSMDVSRHFGIAQRHGDVAAEVVRLAEEVVARLVNRENVVGADFRPEFMNRFLAAVKSSDLPSFQALKTELRRARISTEVLADVYIPAVARELGDMWVRDEASFTEVTVGSSRLQSILREISEDLSAETSGDARESGRKQTATVMLVPPEGEQHTLGALVLSTQLRRMGISVCLSVGPDAAEVQKLVRKRSVDGIMVSAGSDETLESCRNLVKTIKEGAGKSVRIALGGCILVASAMSAETVGADIVTNDAALALKVFGVDVPPVAQTQTQNARKVSSGAHYGRRTEG